MPIKKISAKIYPYSPWIYADPRTHKAVQVIDRPTVFILINNTKAHLISKTPVKCLVDSGADRNLFPASSGEAVGIKIKSGERRVFGGIGDIKIEAWSHKVVLHVVNDFKISTQVNFSYNQEVPLLGMDGFFNKFSKITFDEDRRW